MSVSSNGEATIVSRRQFLKGALVTAASAASFLAIATLDRKEGVKASGEASKYGEGATIVAGQCGYGADCGGGGGSCGLRINCGGGGGKCGMGLNCGGS